MDNVFLSPDSFIFTSGVLDFFKEQNLPPYVCSREVTKAYGLQRDKSLNGGEDKDFFSLQFFGKKLYVVKNEAGNLTIMFPEEY